jgi:hypothetical protein
MSIWFICNFFILYRLNLFFKIKNVLFFIIFLIRAGLDSIYFLWFYSINFIVFFPFILHNRVNDSCCDIEYFYLHLSLHFFLFCFYLSSLSFSIELSWSHDLGRTIDMTWTYLMSRSRVSRDNSALFRAIFLICCCYHIFYCIIKFIKI